MSAIFRAYLSVDRCPPAHQPLLVVPYHVGNRATFSARSSGYEHLGRCTTFEDMSTLLYLVTPQRTGRTFRAVSWHAWQVSCPSFTPMTRAVCRPRRFFHSDNYSRHSPLSSPLTWPASYPRSVLCSTSRCSSIDRALLLHAERRGIMSLQRSWLYVYDHH